MSCHDIDVDVTSAPTAPTDEPADADAEIINDPDIPADA
jgi:hypothetical protein